MNKTFNKIKQRHLEDWVDAYLELLGDRTSSAINWGCILRAAVQTGWLTAGSYAPANNGTKPSWDIDGVEVGEMEGSDVRDLANEINRIYREATIVPLASSLPQPPTLKAKGKRLQN